MKVVVILPTHNGANFIEEQLLSLINQTYKIDKLIISDDNSSDDTLNITLKTLSESKVKHEIHAQKNTLGINKNIEFLLQKANSEIVFFCDQDDTWDLNKVEHYVNHFKLNKNCLGLFSNATISIINHTMWELIKFDDYKRLIWKDDPMRVLSLYNVVQGSTLAIRKEIIPLIIPFNQDMKFKYVLYDYWIAIILSLYSKRGLQFIDFHYMNYRIHDDQNTDLFLLRKDIKSINKILNPKFIQTRRHNRNMLLSLVNHLKPNFPIWDESRLLRIKNWIEFMDDILSMQSNLSRFNSYFLYPTKEKLIIKIYRLYNKVFK